VSSAVPGMIQAGPSVFQRRVFNFLPAVYIRLGVLAGARMPSTRGRRLANF
jgi:hypothetical protein